MPAITDAAKSSVFRIDAPAKINLTLHVTGQRDDGYHMLDSLVVFADVGDELRMQPANGFTVSIEGPEAAGVPPDADNLVLKVARLFDDVAGASFRLTKNVPVASGIGGGSADAAAAFRGMMCLRSGLKPGDRVPPGLFHSASASRLLALGADIPACITSEAVRMQGIGELLTSLRDLPRLSAVLVNPGRPVSTPAIFRALEQKCNPPMPDTLPRFRGVPEFASWLAQQRNDLEPAAVTLEPAISVVLAALSGLDGCLLARMSGSGATCFGLFEDRQAADDAARALRATQPGWWVRSARLGTMTDRALPRIS